MKSGSLIFVASITVFSVSVSWAQPAPPAPRVATPGNLYDSRLGIIKGTSPGIEIIPARKPKSAEAGASSPASGPNTVSNQAVAPAAKPAASASTATQPVPQTGASALGFLQPPSGRSLKDARRLDSPTQGVALPTAPAGAPSGRANR